jgi:hypothetical protein
MAAPEVKVSNLLWFGKSHGAQVYVREVTEDRVVCEGAFSGVRWDLPLEEFRLNFTRDRPDMKSLTRLLR